MAGGVLDRDLVLFRREGFGEAAARFLRRVHPDVGPEDRRGFNASRAPGRSHLHDGRRRKPAQISAQIRAGASCLCSLLNPRLRVNKLEV